MDKIFLFSMILFAYCMEVSAQNIQNDTIYVGTASTVELRFHDPSNGILPMADGSYDISGVGRTSLLIYASRPGATTQPLHVTEGSRQHDFILVYRPKLNPYVIDWSDLNKLQAHVNDRSNKVATNGALSPSGQPEKKENKTQTAGTGTMAPAPTVRRTAGEIYEHQKALGDEALNANEFSVARAAYDSALAVRPDDPYISGQLKKLQTLLGEQQKLQHESQSYNSVIERANAAFDHAASKQDYETARTLYNQALTINSDVTFPKNRIRQIDKIMDSIDLRETHQKKHDDEKLYNSFIHLGDSMAANRDFKNSIGFYNQAIQIRPDASYPKKQLLYVTAQQREVDSIETGTRLRQTLINAEEMNKKGNYQEAARFYREYLAFYPDNAYVKERLSRVEHALENDPSKKPQVTSRQMRDQEAVPASAFKNSESLRGTAPDSIKGNTTPVATNPDQKDAIPYNPEVLKLKYPQFDFNNLPEGQLVNMVDDPPMHYIPMRQAKMEAPRLTALQDTNHKITLLCQGISFKGNTAYMKLLIKNDSESDFLTGTMLLEWKKRITQALIPQKPVAVSDFPVLLPGKAFTVVYAFRSIFPADDEKLIFTLSDRFRKIKLLLEIPGSVYNQERVHELQ